MHQFLVGDNPVLVGGVDPGLLVLAAFVVLGAGLVYGYEMGRVYGYNMGRLQGETYIYLKWFCSNLWRR